MFKKKVNPKLYNKDKKMSDRTKNNYKYFIYAIREYFLKDKDRLDNRKFDSFKLLLDDYISLQNQIYDDKNDKLEKARTALIENIIFYISNTFLKYSDILGEDVSSLRNTLDKYRDSFDGNIYFIVKALRKKIENINLIEIWVELLKKKVSCYDDVDIVLDCMASELVYMGYSVEYICEWWKENFSKEEINGGDLEALINKFISLGIDTSKEYDVLIYIQLPQKLDISKGLKVHKINYEVQDERKNEFGCVGQTGTVLATKVKAIDKFKAIEIAASNIENYIKIYQFLDNSVNEKSLKSCIVFDENKKFKKEMHNRRSNIRELSHREKEDIEDLIEMRNNNELAGVENLNIVDIENAINIIQRLPEFTTENRLLNLWNSMENLARFYAGKSIIAKIIDIVPKIVTMYVLKQKMNLLWDRLIPIIKNNAALQECRFNGQDNKYDRSKFLKFLVDEEKSLELFKQVQENILIQRGVLELHELLKQKDKLQRLVDLTHKSVIHNLNSIYRVRNDLVHNGGIIPSEKENEIRHLQKYLNHFLGILIYYMKRNEEVSIPEILYSIDNTYVMYTENVKKINEVMSRHEKQVSEIKKEIEKLDKQDEKEKKEKELIGLCSEYQGYIENNIETIVFPKYLYLI